MSRLRILLTGGTGFLGKQLVPLLTNAHEVIVLSRTEGEGRIRGDLRQWNAGMDLQNRNLGHFDAMIHLAGLYDLHASAKDCKMTNVIGTDMALNLAQKLEIPIFINASSVAAAINSPLSRVTPMDLNFTRSFPDPYAESKALAEMSIRNWPGKPEMRINLRLGILIGTTTGESIERIDGPYRTIELLKRFLPLLKSWPSQLPLILPGKSNIRLPVIPVDTAAKAIANITQWSLENSQKQYHSFHIVPQEGLSLVDLYQQSLRQLGIEDLKVKLSENMPQILVQKIAKNLIQFPEKEMAYLFNFPRYDSDSTTEILGQGWCPEFKDYQDSFWRGYEKFIQNR